MNAIDEPLHRRVDEVAHHLVTALVQHEIAGSASPATAQVLERLASGVEDCLDRNGVLRFEFVGPEICHGGAALLAASVHAGRLLRIAKERELAGIEFRHGIDAAELGRLVDLLCDERERDAFAASAFDAAARRHRLPHVRPLHRRGHDSREPSPGGDVLVHYQQMSELLQENHVAAAHGDEIEFDRTRGIVESTVKRMVREPSALLALAAYDEIDSYTVGHSVRVALLALQVARAAGCDDRQLLRVGTAALLHDIGKSRIPQELLLKKGRLTPEERQVMSAHPRLGGEILLGQRHLDPLIVGAAFCHHMGENGSGYPRPAFAFQPSSVSRLVRVCDVFEALTAVRPYKPAMTPLHAFATMHRMRDGFDPQVLQFFVHVVGIFPFGTRVLLDDGEEAVVVAHGSAPLRPRVRLLRWDHNRTIEFEAGALVDGVRMPAIQAVIGAGTMVTIPQEGRSDAAERAPAEAQSNATSSDDACACTIVTDVAPPAVGPAPTTSS
jgi:putative nucleotidyltransferase with HDIG domain